ncbi:peptidase M15D vanX D-ala-D-ala dipeptidase [Leadbetterella byssophila DSM 17132]|uniref:D-alanyl-D-alanine dipeptidase n=1 Tax=Leadbetterella byssophila (strain DSM 17132 / JCM 16389 / KACC 11308 / NBRC 106382 / 4M15) TaxID=649349 RepID=E4RZJ1_LEAB4|nr:M15 family metallopeptidase [Leadbetterella byssophila]ADQ17415.1 peptidase M15D vanX D-ala-D-ala dipeptidase [Leadbetterella byssophila DSM 17132]
MGVSCEEPVVLPRALSPEEVNELFPQSENLSLSPYEVLMREQGLLDLQELDPEIKVELKYSSTDNFSGTDLYGNLELAFLQEEAALALVKASQKLREDYPHLRLLVYDAARPLEVQETLWASLDTLSLEDRKNYLADPEEASIHNYGCAVDLTLFDTQTGKPLDMGTPYDYFGDLAYPRLERKMLNEGKLSLRQLNHRILLRSIMLDAGFTPITSEWWHFDFYSRKTAAKKYQLIK